MRINHLVIAALFLLVAAGCSRQEADSLAPETRVPGQAAAGWQNIDEATATSAQRAQKDRAVRAKDLLASTLIGELEEALDSHGPAGAVEVCRTFAPSVAAEVAKDNDVAIGRTSFRLRNPANEPPGWARAAVAERSPETEYFAGPRGQLGVLMPIHLKAECTMCHGTAALRSDEAMAAIRDLYADDRAVGFEEGDLRGWFWVEVPAGAASDSDPG